MQSKSLMKVSTSLTLFALAAVATADVWSTPLASTPFDQATGLSTLAPFTFASAPRAFFLTGDWSRASSGNAFSSNLRGTLKIGTVNYLTTSYTLGGAATTAPFTFGPTNTTWNNLNTGLTPGTPFQMQDSVVSGTLDYKLFAGSGVTGTVQLQNAALNILTDAFPVMTGTLTGAPTYKRAASLTSLASGSAYRYRTFAFTPSVSGPYAVIGDWRTSVGSSYDGFLALYAGSFSPASALTNLVGVDDDGDLEGTIVNRGHTSGMLLRLTAGTTYTIAASEFSNGATSTLGTFKVFVAGPSQSQPIGGTVDFDQLIPDEQGARVDIELRTPGTQTVVASFTDVVLGVGGAFSVLVPSAVNGPVDVAIKSKSRWMRRVLSNVAVGSTSLTATLSNGDVDGDNQVSILDYIFLSANYDSTRANVGDAVWFAPSAGNGDTAPFQSDLDGDDEVSILDYLILSSNFETQGDQ